VTAPRSRREEIEADLEHQHGLSAEEKDRRIQAVVAASGSILQARADRESVLAPEPPAADFQASWSRLVARRAGPVRRAATRPRRRDRLQPCSRSSTIKNVTNR
jgi:hypothetical protein